MKLHEKIYYYRKKAGLSQDALAEKLGVSRQAISKWETAESVPETGKLAALASALGIAFARIGKNGNPTNALNASTYVTTGIFLVLTAVSNLIFFSGEAIAWRVWGASAVGLVVGVIIGLTTDYFTDDTRPIVKRVAAASKSGPAFTILSGVLIRRFIYSIGLY